MAKRDYYEILGVQKGASAEELKKAYRAQAVKHHPDKNPGDKKAEQTFKEISEAYDVLKDDQKRAAYDRFGHQAFEGGMGGAGAHGGGPGMGGFDFRAGGTGGFSDIFEDLFGEFMGGGGRRGTAQQAAARGSDLRYNMEISLEDAFNGQAKNIKISTLGSCETCKGSGAADGGKPEICSTCKGAGKIRMQQGFFTVERPCAACQGTGTVIKNPCRTCHGQGRVRREKTLAVNIPAGVEEGTRIRLSGEGEAGLRGGPAGDLYIFLNITRHPLFEREGQNLHIKAPIKMTLATLGGSIEIPTIEGTKAKLAIPAGTQGGQQLRLKGKGMSVMRSRSRGDMFVHIQVETPHRLNRKQKELLEEFAAASGTDSSPEAEKFAAKTKSFQEDLNK